MSSVEFEQTNSILKFYEKSTLRPGIDPGLSGIS